jgi:TnsA endonuclease N terminal
MESMEQSPQRALLQVLYRERHAHCEDKNMARFKQGPFTPKHPEKYVGDVKKIRFMSSYELQFHEFCDSNPNILRWASEEIAIPYVKPTDGKIHRYYPDYWIEYINKEGKLERKVIEIKPAKQTRRPRKNSKSALYENIQYAINAAKWEAAVKWCKAHGMTFEVMTEKQIYK